MSMPIERIVTVLTLGWVAHVISWWIGVARQRGRIAHAGEWIREILIRVAMVALILWALRSPSPREAGAADVAFELLFLAGTAIAIVGRLRLGSAWGIGVRPLGSSPVRDGIYGRLRHPIYLGTVIALVAQYAILRNGPSALLLVAALVVVPLKILKENAALRRNDATEQSTGHINRT